MVRKPMAMNSAKLQKTKTRHAETTSDGLLSMICRYLVTHLMGADLNNIVKCQKLTDDHVQFLIYQILRGLKVGEALGSTRELSSTLVPYSLLISWLFLPARSETDINILEMH